MKQTTTAHPSPEQWPEIIARWQHSALSGAEFCKQQHLRYANFNYWRKKLTSPSTLSTASDHAEFIDLAALAIPSTREQGLLITLDLGHGMSLSIRRT